MLVALALEGVDDERARVLDEALGTDLSEARVEELRGIIVASGADAQVEAMISDLAQRSLDALEAADLLPEAKAALAELASAATQRTL